MSDLKIAVIGGSMLAPRITPALIDALVKSLEYETHVVKDTTATVATSILPNGYVVATELSACASPENFNPALGIEIAINRCREVSRAKLWELEGYRLKHDLNAEARKASVRAISQIRQLLSPGSEPTLADLLNEQIAELDSSTALEATANAKRVAEMIETYTDGECLGLLLAVLQSRRLGFNAPATSAPASAE